MALSISPLLIAWTASTVKSISSLDTSLAFSPSSTSAKSSSLLMFRSPSKSSSRESSSVSLALSELALVLPSSSSPSKAIDRGREKSENLSKCNAIWLCNALAVPRTIEHTGHGRSVIVTTDSLAPTIRVVNASSPQTACFSLR